jgi:hypothetical protein
MRANLDLPQTCDTALWKTRGKVSVRSCWCNFTSLLVYSRSPLRLLSDGKCQKKIYHPPHPSLRASIFPKLSGAEYGRDAKLLLKLFTELTGCQRVKPNGPYGLFFVYIATQLILPALTLSGNLRAIRRFRILPSVQMRGDSRRSRELPVSRPADPFAPRVTDSPPSFTEVNRRAGPR